MLMAKRDRYGQNPYGGVHQTLRKRFAQRMAMGEVFYCWRPDCPKPYEPINPAKWDLGHVDDPKIRRLFGSCYPEHPSCNRATLPRMLAKAREEGRRSQA
jgi:hypothetical protein